MKRQLHLEVLEDRCVPSYLAGKGDGDASGAGMNALVLQGTLTVSNGPATEQAAATVTLTGKSGGTMHLDDGHGGTLDAVLSELYQGATPDGTKWYYRETYRVQNETGFFAGAAMSGWEFFVVDQLPPAIQAPDMPGIIPTTSSHYRIDLY